MLGPGPVEDDNEDDAHEDDSIPVIELVAVAFELFVDNERPTIEVEVFPKGITEL